MSIDADPVLFLFAVKLVVVFWCRLFFVETFKVSVKLGKFLKVRVAVLDEF
jgi:hypothetical protein